MKHLKTLEHIAQQFQENERCLTTIESLIKTKIYREFGFQKLNELNVDSLNPKHLVYYHYLNGRYYVYCYKQDQDIEALEWANDFFDDMVKIAYQNKVSITNMRFLFSRANVKFQLSQLVWGDERKPWLLQKAKHICDIALTFNPKNENFLWLKSQITT